MEEAPSQGFIYCARCKTRNPRGAERCQNCDFIFGHSTVKAPAETSPPQETAITPRPDYHQRMIKHAAAPPAPESTPAPPSLALSLQPPEKNIYRPKPKSVEGTMLPGRPGLVTVYIAYLVVQMAASALLVFFPNDSLFQISYFWWLDSLSFNGLLAVLLVGTALTAITAVGLWQMTSWGRRLGIIVQVSLLALQIGVTLLRLSSGLPFAVFWAEMFQLEALRFGINVIMLWWLIGNRQRFE